MKIWDVEGPDGFVNRITIAQVMQWEQYSLIEPFGDMIPKNDKASDDSNGTPVESTPRQKFDNFISDYQ